jgi:hypothetical protein
MQVCGDFFPSRIYSVRTNYYSVERLPKNDRFKLLPDLSFCSKIYQTSAQYCSFITQYENLNHNNDSFFHLGLTVGAAFVVPTEVQIAQKIPREL